MLSTVLSLLGYHVHCTCYSKYLSERDKNDFVDLWKLFGVEDQIKYSDISQLTNTVINENGNIRDLVETFVKDGAIGGAGSKGKNIKPDKRILLIDEVDVFFSPDFYGSTYNPATHTIDMGTKALHRHIWDNRHQPPSLDELKTIQLYTTMARQYPALAGMVDNHLKQMLSDVKTFQNPAYEVVEDHTGTKRIGYRDVGGSVCTNTKYGYSTSFAYLHESEQKNLLPETAASQLGVQFICGNFSYAEVPNDFACILGVSGTVSSLDKYEKDIIKNFGINLQTVTPSIYGKSQLTWNSGKHVCVLDNRQEWFQKIAVETAQVIDEQKRAVLIFFEDEETMENFTESSYGMPLLTRQPRAAIKVEQKMKTDKLNHVIVKATMQGAITLLPRVFGRGLDFKVFDQNVRAAGGVHVIQTFLSSTLSEEIQIKGRTARMNAKGSYEMILCAEDLQKQYSVDITTLREREKQAQAYEYLADCRTSTAKQQITARQKQVQIAKSSHQHSRALLDALTESRQNAASIINHLKTFN